MVRINCDKCTQSFNTKKLYVSHLINKRCHKSIREAAKSHSRRSKSPQVIDSFDYPTQEVVPFQNCKGCKLFSKPGLQMYMLSHLASHIKGKAEIHECGECGLKFESAYYLDKHENKKHKNILCDECPKKCKSQMLLRKHVLDVHKKEKCEHCEFYASKENMEKHAFLKHPTTVVCDDCGMFFMDHVTLDKHKEDIHLKFGCDICEVEYENEDLLEGHKEQVHNLSKTTFKQFGGGSMMMMMIDETNENSTTVSEEDQKETGNDCTKTSSIAKDHDYGQNVEMEVNTKKIKVDEDVVSISNIESLLKSELNQASDDKSRKSALSLAQGTPDAKKLENDDVSSKECIQEIIENILSPFSQHQIENRRFTFENSATKVSDVGLEENIEESNFLKCVIQA